MKAIQAEKQLLESVKPFKLVKYLAISTLVVILVCAVILSGFISQKAKELLLKKSEQYALLVAENLNHQVFYLFTLPTLITEGQIRLSDASQHERLDMVVKNTIHGLSVRNVNIYDKKEILVYSTGKGKIGSKGHLQGAFQSALKEVPVSVLSKGKTGFLGFQRKGGKEVLTTYMPMWVEKPLSWEKGRVLGVYEITQDITRDYKTIRRFQWIVALSFLLFVGILFSTILFIARRAERIITARSIEKHKLEGKLHQSERLASLGEMIAGVSHEIRNPLGIIRSTAELLDSRVESERLRKFSSIIVEESTRLNDILTEFLDFAGPQTPRPVPCRIEDILDRNLFVLEAECNRLGISILKHYQTGDYSLEADQEMLYRAFVNIFANALQAMPDGGFLSVHTAISNGRNGASIVEIQVQDSGCGISEEALKKIFNPFFTTRENGTGLGLAIVRTIVDNHSGEIEVASEAGQGAVVIIRLPLTQPEFEIERET
ncbi:MAG: ATP-binding protein [Syntrophobacteraceae bacterium]|nr:ATP-binding protein [Syntrophobacteraceae bacterium]